MAKQMTLLLAACVLILGCTNVPQQPSAAQEPPAQRKTETPVAASPGTVLTGTAAFGDWTTDAPGVRRKITVDDLPNPYSTPSVPNFARTVPRPEGAWPHAPQGFKVEEFATGLENPRKIITAPNGDVFIAESQPNRVRVLRDADNDGKPEVNQIFAQGLHQPFGMAFYPAGPNPQYLYVANTDSVVRFAYHNGDLTASGAPETVANISGGGHLPGGGHWTRDIVFSKDGRKMFVSVGSFSNVLDNPSLSTVEAQRARIFQYNPDGSGQQVYATGIRNAVGLAIHPTTGQLWMSVNERDGLGDNLVPDYISHVEPGGFYGWPWYYLGKHVDERAIGPRPNTKVLVPDVLIQSHSASLAMTFYTGQQFPKEYTNDAFASEHGSWNRASRTGYKVIRVLLKNGKATGVYEDFLTGFVTADGEVWGRPVGVTVARDGSLLVSDDGSGTIWRVRYTGDAKKES